MEWGAAQCIEMPLAAFHPIFKKIEWFVFKLQPQSFFNTHVWVKTESFVDLCSSFRSAHVCVHVLDNAFSGCSGHPHYTTVGPKQFVIFRALCNQSLRRKPFYL